MKFNKYWFKPKRYGIGATPTSWEGWTLVFLFVAFIMLRSMTLNDDNYIRFLVELVFASIILFYVSKDKTNAKWKWRWG